MEEDAKDRIRNEINEVYDNDTNRLSAVQVSIINCLECVNMVLIKINSKWQNNAKFRII